MITVHPSPTLAQLAEAWHQAKIEENRAADLRRELATQIQRLTGHQAESSKTYQDGDWKVTVKQPVNRTMDWEQWEATKTKINEALWPVELKLSLDEKGVKWLQDNDPVTYAVLSECLTTKPGAVSITVARKE